MIEAKNKNLKQLPQDIKDYLIKVRLEADAKRKFKWAADVYEKYKKQYIFDENLSYDLGLFYDHYVIFRIEKLKNKTEKEKLKKIYLKKAEDIYKDILNNYSQSIFALHGLSRVCSIKNDYKNSIYYETKSYKIIQKKQELKNKFSPMLSIGNIYLLKKDYKNAEKWFKIEFKNLPNEDLPANSRMMAFYLEIKDYKKALPYALKTEKLLKAVFQNSFHKKYGTDFMVKNNNKTLKLYLEKIEKIKKLAYKNKKSVIKQT